MERLSVNASYLLSKSKSMSDSGVGVISDSGIEADLALKCLSLTISVSATMLLSCLRGGLVVRVESEEALETREGVERTEGEENVEVEKKVLLVLVESFVFVVAVARCRRGVVKS